MKNPRDESRGFFIELNYLSSAVGVAVEAHYAAQAVVLVSATLGAEIITEWSTVTLEDVGVSNHAVTSLERDTGLEGAWVNSSHHLERYIWAVEYACVIWRLALITNAHEVDAQLSIWIDVDAKLAVQKTSKGASGIIDLQLCVDCG